MESTFGHGKKKNQYFDPIIEVLVFNQADILCLSTEEPYDNEFDAGEMGNF